MKAVRKSLPVFLFGAVVLLLSGCSNTAPITSDSPGIWDHFFVYPFSWLIQNVASLTDGNYGLAIVIMTLLIRTLLLPLMMKQMKSGAAMKKLQPQIDKLKKKYSNSNQDPKQAQKMQMEMMELYKASGVNPMAGCLPALVQMPILMAFYFAIRRTPEIADHSFMWFNLGHADPFYILPLLAAATTFFQTMLSMKMTPTMGANHMKMFYYMMPIMIFMAGMNLPAALPLYWVVGGVFSLVQTYFLNKVYHVPLTSSTSAK
ncbi:membrane protein insertase YidC [Brevibacillus halotolerans]|nr:membrane protein insertase YidC [Brevibacillus halotolerans]